MTAFNNNKTFKKRRSLYSGKQSTRHSIFAVISWLTSIWLQCAWNMPRLARENSVRRQWSYLPIFLNNATNCAIFWHAVKSTAMQT